MKAELSKFVAGYMRKHKLHQQELAELANVPQPIISKVLNKKWKRFEGQVLELAEYVEFSPTIDPRKSKILMNALTEIWDGSKGHELALASLIHSLGDYTSNIK